jgi:hypothetical protein
MKAGDKIKYIDKLDDFLVRIVHTVLPPLISPLGLQPYSRGMIVYVLADSSYHLAAADRFEVVPERFEVGRKYVRVSDGGNPFEVLRVVDDTVIALYYYGKGDWITSSLKNDATGYVEVK